MEKAGWIQLKTAIINYLGFPQTAPASWSDQQLQYLQKKRYNVLDYNIKTHDRTENKQDTGSIQVDEDD